MAVQGRKKKPENRSGAGTGIANDPRFIAVSQGRSRRREVPIPVANQNWHPQAISWFNSLRLSGQSEFYEASDWATAVMAAQLYDHYMRSYKVALLVQFEKLSARLGVTIVDRKRTRIELAEPEVTDADEEAADDAVIAWHGRLGIVRDVGGGDESDG